MFIGGKFVMCGGFTSSEIFDKCFSYDFMYNAWTQTSNSLSEVRIFPYGVRYDEDTWWITGGGVGGGGLTNSSDFYFVSKARVALS